VRKAPSSFGGMSLYPGMVVDVRGAGEALDPDAIAATLADDVVFRSPVAVKPYWINAFLPAGPASSMGRMGTPFRVGTSEGWKS